MITNFLRNESGATAIEYGLIVALIGLVLVSIFIAIGGSIDGIFGKVDAGLQDGMN